MKITILSIGSLGDVQPFLTLAIRLKDAGHDVCMAVPSTYRQLVINNGVNFSNFGIGSMDLVEERKLSTRIEAGGKLSFIVHRIREKQRFFDQLNLRALQICQDAQLIIYRISVYLAAFSIAQQKSIPCVEIGTAPIVRTHTFPFLCFFGIPSLGGPYNWATHVLGEQIIWQFFRHSTNRFRMNVLNTAPFPITGPEQIKREYGVPVLHAFSPLVVKKPPDWPDWAHITGYWTLDDTREWKPPTDLVKFLESGPPPVYVGFGSMPSRDPKRTRTLITEALQSAGQRGVIATGWSGMKPLSNHSDRYFFLESAPHEWLFPRMSAVVHHGGMGTTGASIRSGVPTIIVPHNYDQPFWGKIVAELGVGPKPIPRKRLSSDNLAQAIDLAISDKNMRCQAEDLGRRVREEDGVGSAVNLIHQYSHK
jgi:sterol 3beta-glucosyltransferase